MPYVPPHKRNASKEDEWTTVTKKTTKTEKTNVEKPKKKEYVEEFPSLNKEMESLPKLIPTVTTKPSLSTLFKNSLNRKHKKKQPYIKKGWILLTPKGMFDSLTPEERKEEDEAHEQRIYQIYIENYIRELDRRDNYRREHDHTYLWEWEKTRAEFDKFEPDDDEYDYYSETESDLYDEDNYEDELDLTI